MQYVLMREERETLAFDVDVVSGIVSEVRPLEHASWAPLGILVRPDQVEARLSRFIATRSISLNRNDLPNILQATGARSRIELAFMSGGFSLSDPYWYRARGSEFTWVHGNYFDNDWDQSFGEAVLNRNYNALKGVSLATPDATCSGSSRKAWLRDATGTRLVKAPVVEGGASVVGEFLASRMLARLLPENEFVSYDLVERDGELYSACRPMVGPDDELAFVWQVLSEINADRGDDDSEADLFDTELLEAFSSSLQQLGVEGSGQIAPKMKVLSLLGFNRDMHPQNLGVIRSGTGALRLAPLFDFDRTFGLSQRDRIEQTCANPQFTALMVARLFSDIETSWDYSWYNARALDGFEYEIEREINARKDMPEGFEQIVAQLFKSQRSYLNHMVEVRP